MKTKWSFLAILALLVILVGASAVPAQAQSAIVIGPETLPNADYQKLYSQQLIASGGTEPYTFTISEGSLPAGLTLSSEGLLSGTPTVAGYYEFTLSATDANQAVGYRGYSLTIYTDGVFTFASSSNPSAPGDPVTFTVSATGNSIHPVYGQDPVPPVGLVAFFDDGTPIEGCSGVPLNLGFDAGGGQIPEVHPATCETAALTEGTHQITATYTDYSLLYHSAELSLTQVVGQPVSYTISGDIYDDNNQNRTRDEGEETLYFSGSVYLDQGCDGGTDYTAWIASGGYVFTGIPGGECYHITIELGESGWQQTTQLADFPLSGDTTLDIGFHYPEITLSPSPSELPSGDVGVEYYQQFTASGGTAPYIYGFIEPSLPEGLTLNADASGLILSGTPTVAGHYEFTLGAMDATDAQLLDNYELIVKTDGVFTFTSSSNPSTPDKAVTFTVSATGDAVYSDFGPLPPVALVTFYDDGTPIEGCSDLQLNLGDTGIGNYPATCTTAALEVGSHEITVSYTDYLELMLGYGLYNPPSLAPLAQMVGEPLNTSPSANPGGPYMAAINTSLSFDGSGSSDAEGDALTYAWDFGDSSIGTGATPTHSYTVTGVYNVCLTVNDGAVDSDPICTIAVVYDPSAGFVTGGGSFVSPAGAFKADDSLIGKATFGFVSRYQKGQTIPTGNTAFQFDLAGLSFASTSYDWLVVDKSGANAQFKGSGMVNGSLDPNGNPYKFMIWAGDGLSTASADTFRIKIWAEVNGVENVVYDNGVAQPIEGGNIIVHASK